MPGQIVIDELELRRAIADLDQIDRDLELLRKRVRPVRCDPLIAIGDRKPVVQQINEYAGYDGKKMDLRKYRFK